MKHLKVLVLLSHVEDALSVKRLKSGVGTTLEQNREAVNAQVLHSFEHGCLPAVGLEVEVHARELSHDVGESRTVSTCSSEVDWGSAMHVLHVGVCAKFLENVQHILSFFSEDGAHNMNGPHLEVIYTHVHLDDPVIEKLLKALPV